MKIKAECHSDDRVFEVSFDAVPWFDRASDEEILALAACGWGGDYPADQVAIFFDETNKDIKEMMGYINRITSTRKACGYECHVDQKSAIAWIRQTREYLLDRIEKKNGGNDAEAKA